MVADMAKLCTANRLVDGAVVYLDAHGEWRERLSEGAVVTTDDEGAALLARAKAAVADRLVVDPYLMDVIAESGMLRPQRERERIRAAGPSVRTDLGKQATGG